MASVFVPLQTGQVKVFTPSLVQVGSVVTAPLSQLWVVSFGMDSVLVSSQPELVQA